MDIRIDGEVKVSLSERNLRDLLSQVESGGASNPYLRHEATGRVAQLVRACAQPQSEEDVANGDPADRIFLRVVVETDDYHYGDRRPGPGTLNIEDDPVAVAIMEGD